MRKQELEMTVAALQKNEQEVRALNQTLEQRVQNRTKELAGANEELEAFTAALTHDLRASLMTVSGYCSILTEDYLLSKDAQELLVSAIKGTRQMNQLIEDLLNLSRVGRMELSKTATSLDRLARSCADELANQLKGRRIPRYFLRCCQADKLVSCADYPLLRSLGLTIPLHRCNLLQDRPGPQFDSSSCHRSLCA